MNPTHDLTDAEFAALTTANQLLTGLTTTHDHTCACELCRARMLTDTQDDASRHVPYTPTVRPV